MDRARLHRGRFARLLTLCARADAIVFGRRIFLSPGAEELLAGDGAEGMRLLAHELAHVAQYRRSGAAAFLARYVREYFRRRFAGASHAEAYCAISFEREAEDASRRCAG